ncbi:amidohydrolase [Serratia entomophila]|uniref:amidohydrolase n=1 Tax=Serratia entomophila TaxID=42906 RepID=UPI00217BDD47|nr:amidohydrolase [Serratia entomophila]CAI0849017.1 N-substituted formamide deformylase precursor [Serratia entomophila]CAI1153592.1 N-substituted formamide deformylase precursor [Serratia entomophila]CAI1154954.1 N-substituted formamide deformylase precursor [Serratia entomophila]CAI1156387.1 N-substituted formamide deformylase precursor [Serratia entomophila]CAI1835911.1 N-substituted formamide deformylase precursor [Serratia entomophila]
MSQRNAVNEGDLIIVNAKVTTVDPKNPEAEAIAIRDGRFLLVGTEAEVRAAAPEAAVIDAKGHRVIPGLIDSHTHAIRQGNNFAMEVRWEGITSLSDALRMLKRQAEITPPGQWIRVVGGWSASQFAEKRLPTLAEINAVAPEVPVYVLHLYDRAWLNQAALRALNIDEHFYETWMSGHLERDDHGVPTGLALARPNAFPLYALLDQGPKLSRDEQLASTQQYMSALNGLGLTTVLDCAGGFLNYPDDYTVLQQLHKEEKLTVRFGYQLFAQRPGRELEDFMRWNEIAKSGQGDDYMKCIGAGEMLVASAYDFEDFSFPRPTLSPAMEGDLEPVVDFLLKNNWSIRFHCTYEESAQRILKVIERCGEKYGLQGRNWIFDHGETITPATMERIAKLGGGISYQNRIAFQTQQYRARYGEQALREVMPVRKMMESGVPLASGTDATRVSSYNPWYCIYWLVSGNGMGSEKIWHKEDCLSREEALQHWTANGAWFAKDEGNRGQIKAGQLADLAILSADYFSIPEEEINNLFSVLTLVGGKVVSTAKRGPFASLTSPVLPNIVSWSPINQFGAPGLGH